MKTEETHADRARTLLQVTFLSAPASNSSRTQPAPPTREAAAHISAVIPSWARANVVNGSPPHTNDTHAKRMRVLKWQRTTTTKGVNS